MTHRYIKIGATTVVLVLAFSGLLWSTLRDGTEYYKNVDEVMTNPQEWEGKQLQLHGYVVPGSISRKRDRSSTSSRCRTRRPAPATGMVVDATYSGIVPDTFKDEAEVVLKGRLDADGVPHRPERRHGEVSVEVRGGRSRSPARPRARWPPSARFSCSPRSSSAAMRRWSRVVGARRRSRRLIESGIGAFYLIAALMTAASAVIINAFLTDDFSIKYVSHYSDSVQPLFYKITSYWGGLDGSIMFWVFLLSVFGAIAVYVNRERHRELIPYVVATISTVQMFFLYLMVVHKNPFTTYLTAAPADGEGLNPLLQNYWMAIHPPSLYTGFVGMTIPFAFGIAALITGHLDDSWLRAVRRWTMFSWLFLSFGLTLGMIWAYEELGWGGYWGWDPVENAGLLPWFTATAFLHSVMVQERRSMLRVWNVTLVILTFFLTIFGTFMTRSGVVQSVHAFGEDPDAGPALHHLHGRDPHLQLRAGDLPAAAAPGAQRARLVGVARGGVPRQQLDSAVLRVLRPLRDDVPDAQRSGDGRAPHGRRAVLQQVDGADRPGPAAPDRHRSAARLAQVDADQPARSVPLAGGGGDRDGRRAQGVRHRASGRRASASRCARS